MPVLRQISLSGAGGSNPSIYDIGAMAENVMYDPTTNIKDKIDSKQSALQFDTEPIEGSNNPVTSDGIANALATLEANFQAGVDAVYAACASKGSTPESHSLTDIVDSIGNIGTDTIKFLFITDRIYSNE